MKLSMKIWLLMIVSSIVGLTIFIGATFLIGHIFSNGYVYGDLNQIGQQVVKEAELHPAKTGQIKDLMDRTAEEHPDVDLEWITQDGSMVYATNGRTQNYDFNEMITEFTHMPYSLWTPDLDITLAIPWGSEQAPQYLIMRVPDKAMQSTYIRIYIQDNSQFFLLLLPFLLFLATPYIFTLIFFSRIKKRLRNLTKAMNDVDAENTHISIRDHSKDEIGQLSRHFNTMSKRISDQISQIQEFERKKKTLIANISHDLRTPMTTIQGFSETLYEELDESDKEKKAYTEIILQRSRYMDILLQKLLEISNLDSLKGDIELKESNVTAHLRKIAADFVHVLESKEITFDVQIPDQPIYALTDAYLFERAIRNLIENAIQYGGSGHYLGIAAEQDQHEVRVRVIDHGPGISPEQLPLIFERFYRGSDARHGDGMGIGLSIVHEIAKMLGGRVKVDSKAGEKTEFTLTVRKSRTEDRSA